MKLNLVLYLVFIRNLVVASTKTCTEFNASMTQIVEREGFKREIKWLIEVQSPESSELINSKCELALRFVASSGIFVNPDELAELQRFNHTLAYVAGDVNIEAPQHDSKEHVVYIFIPIENIKRISVSLPIHLRYQRAQIAGGFGKVLLSKPSLLAYFPEESKQCKKYSHIKGPTNYTGLETRVWKNITYQALFEEVELFVPVGNLDDYPLVAVVTLLLGCCGCIYILSILSTAPL